tara:strand:+ start:6601 stop:7536 length:936 start_codon:yes stop_codon:yes gene_type:complete
MTDPAPIVWAVADTRRGVENQAVGLASAVAEHVGGMMGRVTLRDDGFASLPDTDAPDIWIGCGRPAIRLAKRQRRAFAKSMFVYVQDPRGAYGVFDVIVAPRHDRLRRSNVIASVGAPHRITRARLDSEAARFADRLAQLPGPRAAILIGGPSKQFRFNGETTAYLTGRVGDLLERGLSVMVSVSRRTPASLRTALVEQYGQDNRVWLFDGDGDNPYFAFLAAADWIFVTEDSTNMLTEAAATGTPVYSLPLGGSQGKFGYLHAALEGHGALRPFLGRLDTWTYPPLDETTRIAALVARQWKSLTPHHVSA